MLLILADVYRIATFRAPDPPRAGRRAKQDEADRACGWFRIVGLLR